MRNSILFALITFLFLSCSTTPDEWESLMDQDLSKWDRYLSYKHQLGYDGQQPKDADGNLIPPIGLNKDGFNVFTVTEDEGEEVLKISGEIYGCLITKKEYANYHLRLKMKWGDKKFDPRKNLLMDSGILYHSIGPLGAEYWRTWMLSQEFQVMEGHLGDYWSQITSAIDVRAYLPEYIMNPVADVNQPFLAMGQDEEIQGFCLRSGNYEKAPGEWNTLELVCFDGNSIHIVNGEVVMVLRNSRYIKDGETLPLDKGKIQIQSEAAEVFYKDIEIKELDEMPEDFAVYYN
ncbi:DUF1080 domain-containing protein [Draconibacterium sp. IB214405]|uniref:3-keto-disaccharide hydrolase n=1 Tax=Draconibacterium sp. IB214405 TaxID=3097352 RepID=UPI002A0F9A6E|nr:DUF1080 domain-containing protein [Draconibacterium sp. IB214405]MDX8340407.1 DUF1080 domain-containing protein [Draconibacterium sp. IB214405]